MNIRSKIVFLLLINSLVIIQFLAQTKSAFGYLPNANITAKLNEKSSLNFGTQHRFGMSNSINQKAKIEYVLSDFNLMYSKRIGVSSKFYFGGLIRYRNGEWVGRTIQQIVLFSSLNQIKFSHRIRLDQTYISTSTVHRLRYRLGMQIPLNGIVLDNKEAYLKINNEVINILENTNYRVEYRLSPNYGYVVSKKLKLELGLDYRLSNLSETNKNQDFWLLLGVYYKLN